MNEDTACTITPNPGAHYKSMWIQVDNITDLEANHNRLLLPNKNKFQFLLIQINANKRTSGCSNPQAA